MVRELQTHLHGIGRPDGHTRITKGAGLTITGGSEETHAQMQEHAIKLGEKLKSRGKTIQSASEREVMDTLLEIIETA